MHEPRTTSKQTHIHARIPDLLCPKLWLVAHYLPLCLSRTLAIASTLVACLPSTFVDVCMYACMHVCTYARMHVCTYARTHVVERSQEAQGHRQSGIMKRLDALEGLVAQATAVDT